MTTYRIRAEGELEAKDDAAAGAAISQVARLLANAEVGHSWRLVVNRDGIPVANAETDDVPSWDTTDLRRVSSVERNAEIPWSSPKSPMILVAGREIVFATDTPGKRILVRRAGEGVLLFIWEGTYRSDVFVVDDAERAAAGLTAHAEAVAGL